MGIKFPKWATKQAAVEAWMDRDFSFVSSSVIPDERWFEGVEVLGSGTVQCPECSEEFDRDDFISLERKFSEDCIEGEGMIQCPSCEAQLSKDDLHLVCGRPMWGTLFVANGSAMESILRDRAAQLAEKANVRVFEDDEVGVFIGVDGAGYNFYTDHWIPLYEAIGFEGYKHEVTGAEGLRILAEIAEHWIDDEGDNPIRPGLVIGDSNTPLRERIRNALANVYSVEVDDDVEPGEATG